MGKHPGTAVIFIHGIQGRPEQFDFLIASLPKDVSVHAPLLPGHGGSIRDFKRTGKEAWLDCVRQEIAQCLDAYDRVFFVGHSMGCLLGLLAARALNAGLSGMLLLCCPFSIRLTPRYLYNNILSAVTRGNTKDPFIRAAWEATNIHERNLFRYLGAFRPFLDLFTLMKQARHLPPGWRFPILFCFSQRDEIVSPASAKIAEAAAGTKALSLSGCGHNYSTSEARSTLIRELGRLLTSRK